MSPALASLGVMAYVKRRYKKAVRYIDTAIKWAPEIKEHEGGYYNIYKLLSEYKMKPDSFAQANLEKALKILKAYIPSDPEMIEPFDELQNYVETMLRDKEKHNQKLQATQKPRA